MKAVEVAILVPGIMGSQLYHEKELIWPGPAASYYFPYKLMDKLLEPNLVVGDIIRSYSLLQCYGSLIQDLESCGFCESDKTLNVCPYDWRKRNEDAAETLANKIDEATVDHGAKIKLTLIAHSMGGLISRYYLESRLFEKRRGFPQIKRLITLGTPHRGAPLALTAALGMEKRLFLNKEQVKELAAQIEFPSLYQLLPPEDEHFVWDDREAEAELAPFSVDRNWT